MKIQKAGSGGAPARGKLDPVSKPPIRRFETFEKLKNHALESFATAYRK
jgi:hypothetical protein